MSLGLIPHVPVIELGPSLLTDIFTNISVANLFVLPVKFGDLKRSHTNRGEFNACALGAGFELVFV